MRAAGAEKIEYFIIFIIFQHRRLPRREAFGATVLEIFGDFTGRESPEKVFWEDLACQNLWPEPASRPNPIGICWIFLIFFDFP